MVAVRRKRDTAGAGIAVSLPWTVHTVTRRFGTWQEQIIYTIGASGAPVLGGLIAARRPRNPYGWLWCGLGLATAVSFFVQGYVAYTVAGSRALAVSGAVLVAGGVGWVAFVALTPFVLLLFPNGRLPSPRWRLLVWTVVAAGAVSLISSTFAPGQSGIAPVQNPFGVGGLPGEVALVCPRLPGCL